MSEPRCRECGCTELQPCEGGCAWIEPGLCSRCMPELRFGLAGVDEAIAAGPLFPGHGELSIEEQARLLLEPIGALELTPALALALHGNLCLALRHPENHGHSRALVEQLVEDLEALLEGAGVLNAEQLLAIHRVEAEAAPRIVLASG